VAITELSRLCVECGLCCDGSLFRFLPVEPADSARHQALSLPVVTQSGRLAMALPCRRLEVRRCSVYDVRPPGCRGFVCHLGSRLERQEVAFLPALALVREAQRRIEVLRQRWPGAEPVVQRATAAKDSPPSDAALEALRAVHEWLDAHLHWPE